MDREFDQLGQNVTFCPYRNICPGITGGRVINAPEDGILPRGMIVWPETAIPEQIKFVVLGVNPGTSEQVHRNRFIQIQRSNSREKVFEAVNQYYVDGLGEFGFHKKVLAILDALMPAGRATPTLWAEVTYCESIARDVKLGAATVRFCAANHLTKQLSTLSDDTYVMCVGGDAYWWFERYELSNRFRWFGINHVSWQYGDVVGALLTPNGFLTPHIEAQWNLITQGSLKGAKLR